MGPPLENHKVVDFLKNTVIDPPPLENHKAIAVSIQCRADGGPLYLLGIGFLRNTGTDPLSPL